MEYIKDKWYWFEVQKHEYMIRCNEYDDYNMYTNEVYFLDGVCINIHREESLNYCKGLATSSQIEQCLIAYARKNGYVEGIKFYNVNTGSTIRSLIAPLKYNDYTDTLYCKDGNVIYNQGRWADIVQEPKEVDIPLINDSLKVGDEWISVKDRLPKEIDSDGFGKVLCISATTNFITTEYWNELQKPGLTHWMPLPKPPKL